MSDKKGGPLVLRSDGRLVSQKREVNVKSILALMFSAYLCGALSAQTVSVTPDHVLADESATIHVVGLQPGEHALIRSDLTDGASEAWAAEAEFVADSDGTIDTSKQAPVKGSYSSVSALGLVWSMRPVAEHVVGYSRPRALAPQIIRVRLVRNGGDGPSAELVQDILGPGVQIVRVEGKLRGILYEPNGKGPFPGVLVVGGSEGGIPGEKAVWLASHGYAAFALAYFHLQGLPSTLSGIPLEYFGSGIQWMIQRPEIESDEIAVVGTSRGGELALQLGSMYAQLKAVVAYVPANTRYPACCGATPYPFAWTWTGKPLAFATYRQRNDPAALEAATIRVEKTKGPILMISGEDDQVWNSSGMTDAISNRLKSSHFEYLVERLNYPKAGHRAGRPEIAPEWHGPVRQPVSGGEENLGGSPAGDAESSIDAIPKVLEFLCEGLRTCAAK